MYCLGKVFMKDILSAYRKRLAKSLAVLVIVAVALLLARGEGHLAFAFLLGLVAALVFVWNMAFRLWNLSTDVKTAHRQMLWGMFLRLAVLALVLLAAAMASSEVMLTAAAGFLATYFVALGQLLLYAKK